MISTEQVRNQYRPSYVKILFIGESPPANSNNFFYLAKSNLFRSTKKAFSRAFQKEWEENEQFLRYFQAQGCYLDDLSLEPLNKMEETLREKKRTESVEPLSDRIHKLQNEPQMIIVVMKQIVEDVKSAFKKAGLSRVQFHELPFPRYHQKCYEKELEGVLRMLIQQQILSIETR